MISLAGQSKSHGRFYKSDLQSWPPRTQADLHLKVLFTLRGELHRCTMNGAQRTPRACEGRHPLEELPRPLCARCLDRRLGDRSRMKTMRPSRRHMLMGGGAGPGSRGRRSGIADCKPQLNGKRRSSRRSSTTSTSTCYCHLVGSGSIRQRRALESDTSR
jgi:hypothetical protein